MKKIIRPKHLPWITLALSLLGAALRVWLYATGKDDKGFFVNGHPAEILLWILSVLTVAALFWLTRPINGQGAYRLNFPASIPGALGCWALAAGLFVTALGDLMGGSDSIATVTGILGVLCVPALIFAGYSRYCGTRSSFLLYTLVSVFCIARMVCQYRQWSADPQLQDYCFQMFACVGLMLTFFQRATFDVKMGRRGIYAFTNLATFYFCVLSIPYCEQKLFYIVNALWLITNLCSLRPLKKRAPTLQTPPEPPVEEAPTAEPPVVETPPEEAPGQPADLNDLFDLSAFLADLPDLSSPEDQ